MSRDGSFSPKIVRKRQRRFEGFDEKVHALYSRGPVDADIEAHIAEIYGVHVGRDLISRVTEAVMDDARAWPQRPLEDVYPAVPKRAKSDQGQQRCRNEKHPEDRDH